MVTIILPFSAAYDKPFLDRNAICKEFPHRPGGSRGSWGVIWKKQGAFSPKISTRVMGNGFCGARRLGAPLRRVSPLGCFAAPAASFFLRNGQWFFVGRDDSARRFTGFRSAFAYDGLPYLLCRCATSPPDRGSRPPVPHLREQSPLAGHYPPGAENLSGWRPFRPGHWALAGRKISAVGVPETRLACHSQRPLLKGGAPKGRGIAPHERGRLYRGIPAFRSRRGEPVCSPRLCEHPVIWAHT